MLLTWLLVVYVVLSFLHAKELRYALLLSAPLIGFCAIAVITVCHWLGSRVRAPEVASTRLATVVSLLIALAAFVIQLSQGQAWLVYDHARVLQGEVWRLFTCHLAHWSWDHFIWDTLTLVAFGTSLPELAASMVAAARGYSSLAVGNVIGSNIFNIFLIFGVVGQIDTVTGSVTIDSLALPIGFLVGVTLLGVVFMRGSRVISRAEGFVLLGAYASYIVFVSVGVN